MDEAKDAGSNAVAQDQPFPAGPPPGKAISSPSGSSPVPGHLRPPPAAESRGKGRENDMCYYCKEKGHWAEDCPSEMMKRRKITMPLKTTRSRRLPAAARGLRLSSPVPARVAAAAASDETARAEKGGKGLVLGMFFLNDDDQWELFDDLFLSNLLLMLNTLLVHLKAAQLLRKFK